MTRDKLLMAVVEAAREIAGQLLLAEMTQEDWRNTDVDGAYDDMIEMIRPIIRALDAHRPEPEGEMVEVRAYVRLNLGHSAYIVSGMGDLTGKWQEPMHSATIATITARVPLPRIPEIAATVAPVEEPTP